MKRLREIALVFLKLGCTAFGGPAAHVGMMEEEFVKRRKWLSHEHFLDLISATHLIPGPNSTEMTIHLGFVRGGVSGLVVAGMAFIFPATVITLVLGWVYVRFHELPQVDAFTYGIKPAVIAIILGALWRLGKQALKERERIGLAVVVVSLVLAGFPEVPALLGGGIVGAFCLMWLRHPKTDSLAGIALGSGLMAGGLLAVPKVLVNCLIPVTLPKLGLFFLKVGAVLFGSGYVLVAFLQGGLVEELGWLTEQQLLDAIAVGQFTPGPVLCTSTFIGYLLAGVPGAVVATVGIFLPSFFLVFVTNPWIPRMRKSPVASAFLDSFNACAIGLMAAVVIQLARATLTDWGTWIIAVSSAGLLFKFPKISLPLLVVGGAVVGWVLKMIGG